MEKRGCNPFLNHLQLSEDEEYYINNLATKRPRFTSIPKNGELDMDTKRASLKVSSSVVSMESYSGEEVLSQGCGTIIEVDGHNTFVITSASLVRRPTEKNVAQNILADKLKVVVHTSDEASYIGKICTCDFHYNLLVIVFKSNSLTEAARLRPIDIHENVFEEKPFQLRPHSVKVKPRDPVIVVGRYFYKPYVYMAAPGSFSVKHFPGYECKELLQASCSITRCGDGGPLINQFGEVIGIAFYHSNWNSPILPINIPYKWWDHYKRYKESRHPSYGFEARNLEHSAVVATLEKVKRKFPSISSGVVVIKVLPGSYAQSAGLRQFDIIIKCDGKTVKNFLELWELMFDKVGESVEFEVARVALCSIVSLRMLVTEATTEELYESEENEVGGCCNYGVITVTLFVIANFILNIYGKCLHLVRFCYWRIT